MQEQFKFCLTARKIQSTWKEAKMTLLGKDGRNQEYPDSYHPISLLNIDYKILMTILAERLSKIMGAYVSDDQTDLLRTYS